MEDPEKLKQAEQLYERALQLDPKFRPRRRASFPGSRAGFTAPSIQRRRAARKRVPSRNAPSNSSRTAPEGHLALGFSFYYGDRDYENALEEFAIAQRGLPNDAEVYLAIGAIQRRQGKWKESNANLEKAASLNPNDTWPLQNLALNYQMLRDFDAANKTIDRALKLSPIRWVSGPSRRSRKWRRKGVSRSPSAEWNFLGGRLPESERAHHGGAGYVDPACCNESSPKRSAARKASETNCWTKEPEALCSEIHGDRYRRRRLQKDEAGRAGGVADLQAVRGKISERRAQ